MGEDKSLSFSKIRDDIKSIPNIGAAGKILGKLGIGFGSILIIGFLSYQIKHVKDKNDILMKNQSVLQSTLDQSNNTINQLQEQMKRWQEVAVENTQKKSNIDKDTNSKLSKLESIKDVQFNSNLNKINLQTGTITAEPISTINTNTVCPRLLPTNPEMYKKLPGYDDPIDPNSPLGVSYCLLWPSNCSENRSKRRS